MHSIAYSTDVDAGFDGIARCDGERKSHCRYDEGEDVDKVEQLHPSLLGLA